MMRKLGLTVTSQRAIATLATSAAVVMMAAAGASAATTSGTAGSAPASPAPAAASGREYIGEFTRKQCYNLRDSYAGTAECVRNAGGLYDLYVWV